MKCFEFRTEQEHSLDLSLLYSVLASQRTTEDSEAPGVKIWQLVIIQLSLLLPVIVLLLCWRYFPARLRCASQSDRGDTERAELPPSYSTADLFSLGVSVVDHLQPPPDYLDLSLTSCRSCSALTQLAAPVRTSHSSRAFLRQDSSLSVSGNDSRIYYDNHIKGLTSRFQSAISQQFPQQFHQIKVSGEQR